MRPGLRFNASPHLLAVAGSLAQQRRQIPSQSSSKEDLENDGVHRLSTPALLGWGPLLQGAIPLHVRIRTREVLSPQ
jgi:hypothetical protein